MYLNSYKTYRVFKYAVYAFLTLNIALFFHEEWVATAHRFVDGIGLADVSEAFAASIDTASWVVLLLMFELETYVLEDRHSTKPVTVTLHVLRALCYGFIVYAFFGYVTKLLFLQDASLLEGVTDVCTLVTDRWAYAIDLDEYTALTADNCAQFAAAGQPFFQFPGLNAVVDQRGLTDIVRLAWVDVVNSGVWLGVVFVLEVDVRLQEADKLKGLALQISTFCKLVFYPTLLLAAVYWGFKGDFVDFWDAFLWLVAFIFIERNLVEWRQESFAEIPGAVAPG